jgi:copper chaperone CopZ
MRLYVAGMSCRHCVREVTARLRDVEGVEIVAADADAGVVVLTGTMSDGAVVRALEGLSYQVRVEGD